MVAALAGILWPRTTLRVGTSVQELAGVFVHRLTMTLPDDDVFLDEVFDLAVQRHALGEPLELTQLLSGREHLRARIGALLSVCIWDADVPGQRQRLAHDGPVWGLAWRSDGAYLVSATEVSLYVWDTKTWVVHARYRLAALGRTLAFAPDDRLLAVGHADGSIAVLRSTDLIGPRPSASEPPAKLPVPEIRVSMGNVVHEVRFSPRGWFAATSSPGLLVWDLESGRELCRFPLGVNAFGLAVHPDGNRVAAGTNDGRIGIFDVEQRREVAMIPAHEGRVMALTWLAEEACLLSAGADRSIRAWSNSGAQADVMVGHVSGLVGLAVLGDGRVVSAGSARNASDVRVWDGTSSGVMVKSTHGYHSIRVALDPGGIWFAWSTSTNVRSYIAVGHLAAPNREGSTLLSIPVPMPLPMAVSSDGVRFAVGTRTGVAIYSREVMTALANAPLEPLASPLATIEARDMEALAFGPTSEVLAFGSADGTVTVWDIERGRALRTLALPGGAIRELALSSAGQHLAAATSRHAVLFDLVSGERVVEWSDLRHCDGLAFSPDGQYLALAHQLEQPVITLWGRTPAAVHAVLRGHNGQIHALAFSPDGQRLASGSADHTVRLWDPHSGMAAATLHDHSYLVRCVAWSSDGTQLVSSSADGVMWFRRAPGSPATKR